MTLSKEVLVYGEIKLAMSKPLVHGALLIMRRWTYHPAFFVVRYTMLRDISNQSRVIHFDIHARQTFARVRHALAHREIADR